MWEFRTKLAPGADVPEGLLELFDELPELGELYHYRWRITEIFDTATSPVSAAEQFEAIRRELAETNLDLSPFFDTYDRHKEGILAYFEERKTSSQVEGINNKARVITRRCFGLKSATSLWTRLLLDLNHAADVVHFTIERIHELMTNIKRKFAAYYT